MSWLILKEKRDKGDRFTAEARRLQSVFSFLSCGDIPARQNQSAYSGYDMLSMDVKNKFLSANRPEILVGSGHLPDRTKNTPSVLFASLAKRAVNKGFSNELQYG